MISHISVAILAQAIGFKSLSDISQIIRSMNFIQLLYQLIAYIRGGQIYRWLYYVEFCHGGEQIYRRRDCGTQFSIRLAAAALFPISTHCRVELWHCCRIWILLPMRLFRYCLSTLVLCDRTFFINRARDDRPCQLEAI